MRSREVVLLSGGVILGMESVEVDARVGWVGVVEGRIEMVSFDEAEAESFRQRYEQVKEVDCRGRVVMPGLINTHCHISMTLMRNYADDHELMDWLNNYIWPFEALQSDEDIAAGARLGVAELLLGGCTTFVDMYWNEWVIAQVVKQMGGRAHLCEAVLDGRESLFVEGLVKLVAEASECDRVSCGVGPHAPYTCSPETMKLAKTQADKYGIAYTIHLSETDGERAMIEERYGCSPLDYVERAGMLNEQMILAHTIHVTDEEIERIAKSGASVAHNPQSNMKLASGVAPVAKMMRQGVNCTVATDGACSNNDLDMWDEMRSASMLQRVVERDPMALKAYEVLRMATYGAAKALGRSDLGVVKEGAVADIVIVDL
ncbi:MAG: amidohydrolase, partial [Rikenellaceae bacterium]